jgi:hypothetical protein
MTPMKVPQSFEPGAPADTYAEHLLGRIGFEPGYPLFAVFQLELMDVLHILTASPLGEAGSPLLRMSIHTPEESGETGTLLTPMRVEEVRRVWPLGENQWYLKGRLEGTSNPGWRIGRRTVQQYNMQVSVSADGKSGYAQFVPIGIALNFPTQCEGFCWADASSHIPPHQ